MLIQQFTMKMVKLSTKRIFDFCVNMWYNKLSLVMRLLTLGGQYKMEWNENISIVETIQRREEAMGGRSESVGADSIKKAISSVMSEFGIRNVIDDVRKDNIFWQVDFSGTMSGSDRKAIAGLAAEMLGINPESIRMIGLYSES